MINLLKGTVTAIEHNSILLMLNGIGFSIATPRAEQYPLHEPITLHTVLHWSPEQGPQLFGFSTESERSLFQLLMSCPGVGPKLAITLLSHLTVTECCHAILHNNSAQLSAVKGLGTKKAETIIMHLRDKGALLHLATQATPETTDSHRSRPETTIGQLITDVSQALSALHYSTPEVTSTLNALRAEGIPSDTNFTQLMRRALLHVARSSKSG